MAKYRHVVPSCLFKSGMAESSSRGRFILFGSRKVPWAIGIQCPSGSLHTPGPLSRTPHLAESPVGKQSTCRAISGLREFMSWAMVLSSLCLFWFFGVVFFFPPKTVGFHLSPFWENPAQGSLHCISRTGNAGSAAQSSLMLSQAQLLNWIDAGERIEGGRSLRPAAGKDHSGPEAMSQCDPPNQLKFHHAPVQRGELELGSSVPATYGDSEGSQRAILQYPGWRRDCLFPVSSSANSKSRQINLAAAMFKTNKRKWLTTGQTGELRNSSPKRLRLQEVWWGSNEGCRSA